MGSSLLEFQSVGGHGCNREAKVGEEVMGCGKMGCPDCESRRAVVQLMTAGVGTFERARFVHWPGSAEEVVDEFEWVPSWTASAGNKGPMRVKVTRRKQDFQRNKEAPPAG
jgi:hypothetical protein